MNSSDTPTPDPNQPDPKRTVPLLIEDHTPTVPLKFNQSNTSATSTQQRSDEPQRCLKVFISYAHADQELRKKLEEHLGALKHARKITIWHDQEIPAGANFEDLINTQLNGADVILLLVSASFIASNYCWNKEVLAALERHKTGKVRVIPIILKPTDWKTTPLAQIQALPAGAKPVTEWNNQDTALENAAQGIRRAVEHLLSEDGHGDGFRELWKVIHPALSNAKQIMTQKSQTLSLLSYVLLIVFLVVIGLYFFVNDISLLIWVIAPLIAMTLFALLLRIDAININTPVKTGERRVLLSAVSIGFLAVLSGSLLKQGNLKRDLETGELTQLRMALLPGKPKTPIFDNTLSDLLGGIPVSSLMTQTYADAINALAREDVEIAWLGPFSYLRAHQIYGARATLCNLTQEHQETYRCYIIANVKANIHVVEDLKGTRFALVDPNSASGNIIPLYELKKAGLDIKNDITTFYAGTHEKVLDQVLREEAHAGAIKSDLYSAALKAGQFHEGDLVIVKTGKDIDIPKGPIVVRKDISYNDELRIEDALLTVSERFPAIMSTMGMGGFAKAIHENYEFLFDIAKELNIDITNLE